MSTDDLETIAERRVGSSGPPDLRELLEKATPGPWHVDTTDHSLDVIGAEHAVGTIYIHLAGGMTIGDDAVASVRDRALADADLCALVPQLAELVLEAEEAIQRLLYNAGLIFDKKPVRDWGETLAEGRAWLARYYELGGG